MVSPIKPEVDEASLRYQSRTKLAELSNDIASTGSLNKSKDKLLHATKIRLWLKALDLKNYLSREQRERIWYALIDISGIYDFPTAPTIDYVPRPNILINGTGGGAGTTPGAGGFDMAIQFNDNGVLAGDPGFIYDKVANIATIPTLEVTSIANASIDTDKFLVSDGGTVKYRTGAQLLADIGGANTGMEMNLLLMGA